ncbi:MAG TPA: GlxA family transcriptional regulator [Stellaceae bacterium]|nr:GlxA family transcriptional regulator [Stellaceae bacterium]
MLFSARTTDQPLVIDLLVVDGFSLMSLAATMEPLRAANRVSGRPLYDWRLVSPDGKSALSSSGVPLPVSGALDPKRSRDALIVVAAFEAQRRGAGLAARLRAVARAGVPLGGIESGAWLLAKAGLLDGYRATAHWEEVDEFAAAFRAVDVVADRFVIDRDRFTAGGATPALDMMLHLIRVQHGMTIALNVASIFIYDQEHLPADRQPIVQVGRLGFVEPRLTAAIRLMEGSIEEPLTIARIAAEIGLSARSMQTLFTRHLGAAPRTYYLDLRLDAARRLLQQTRRSLVEIAVACGFASASAFSRAFRRRYGRSPRELRREGVTTGALRRVESSGQAP